MLASWYPSGVAVDEPRGLVYFLVTMLVLVSAILQSWESIWLTGAATAGPFDYSASASTSGGRATAVDAAGNVTPLMSVTNTSECGHQRVLTSLPRPTIVRLVC